MKSLYFLSVLSAFLIYSVVCQRQYQWNCTEPNENGERYIPSQRNRDLPSGVTSDNSLLIFHVSNLDANCYGPVTAIEYCYRYSTSAGSGKATLNWTVLILKDAGSSYVINRTHVIQSNLPTNSANCTRSKAQVTSCDVTNIDRFDIPINFIFGVTESAQGNTHGATLLGYYDSLSQHTVPARRLSNGGLTLSVGSTVPSTPWPVSLTGLRFLWFIVGEQHSTTVSTLEAIETTIESTPADPLLSTQEFLPTMTIIPITEKKENETTTATTTFIATNNPGVSVALIVAVVVGVAGSLLVLAIFLLSSAVVWMAKKKAKRETQYNLNHLQTQSHVVEQREAVQQKHQGDEAMEINSNYAITRQIWIPTEDNVAYGQATSQSTTEGNLAYGQREHENDYVLLSDQCEYDYI